jgi:hypothetical protein
MKLAILNTSIVTADGDYTIRTISHVEAVATAHAADGIDSAVSHPSTAVILTGMLGIEVPVNDQMFTQQPGQQSLVFKLNGRPPTGKELSLSELEEIGFSFKILTRTA